MNIEMAMEKSLPPILFNTQKVLGSLELEVMKVVWKKEKCTVRDVVEDLREEKTLAYTTIMTVMDNLYKKGFVKRVKVKKTYHYAPYASENLFIQSSISKTFQSLISEYGKLTVLVSLIPVQVNLSIPKLNPTLAFYQQAVTSGYKIPVTIGFLTSLVLGLFTLSLWDLLQGLTFLGSVDYLKLALSEPEIIFNQTSLLLGAFFESLPIISLLTNLILLIFTIFIIRKITKLLDFKFPMFFRIGGLVLR